MDNTPSRHDFTEFMWRVLPPIILATMAKIASEYKKTRRMSFLSMLIVTSLAACGSVVGYWVSKYLQWAEYRMTLTIFFFGLFSDKMFEFLFSKTFLNNLFNFIQDWLVDNIRFLINRKKDS